MNTAFKQTPAHRPLLLVEDDADVRESIAEMLRDEGYAVAEAENGADALQWLKGNPDPCLILLDLWMPKMTGDELHQHLKQDPRLASVPIVVVTAASDGALRARQIGAKGYLKKPLNLHDLLRLVEKNC